MNIHTYKWKFLLNQEDLVVNFKNYYFNKIFKFFYFLYLLKEIFDVNGSLAFLPNILHVVIVSIINSIYMKIVVNFTKQECHDTKYKHDDSIILKRFVFEFFSYFMDLFYVAFINFNIISLRNSLVSLYTFDEIRRVVTETLIPLLKNYYV